MDKLQKRYEAFLSRGVVKVVNKKCIVRNCNNQDLVGLFVGDLCSPCYEYIKKGIGERSQIFKNIQQEIKISKKRGRKKIKKFKLKLKQYRELLADTIVDYEKKIDKELKIK